jgi:hypothetical protein
MTACSLNGLIKLSFVFLPFYSFGQSDTALENNDSQKSKKDTTAPPLIRIAANPQLKENGTNKILVGANYRKEWIQPVEVPIIKLSNAYGGLVPKKLGGGKETKSLRVEDSAGRQWALRSVEKFPENVIPPELRKTIGEKLINDGISASYPYGVLSVSTLSSAANVPFFKNTLVYVADDPALGEFRSRFKNMLVFVEEKEPSGFTIQNNPSPAGQENKNGKIFNTNELIDELANGNNSTVDQLSVLRARLLDNFVMDFDRHENQWDWLGINSTEGQIFYPLPHDRDQAFYRSRGVLSKFVSGKNILPETQGFRAKTKEIRTFNRPSQNFDRVFLNELSEDDWSKQIDTFLTAMTDSVIEVSLHQQPGEIKKFSTEKIIKTLKQKRQYFKREMMVYYRFLSRTVSIVGTNKPEQFLITKMANGSVSIIVNRIDSSGNVSSKYFERIFDPAITKEIRIYGLEGNDRFVTQGKRTKIKIRLIGGPGNDEFINNSRSRKMYVYDVRFEQNVFSGCQTFHKKISSDPQSNNYTRLGYLYDSRAPGISIEYSLDGGLYVGLRLKTIKQGFRKEPYSYKSIFVVNKAINSSSYHIRYNADFIKVFGKTDLLFRSDALIPTSRTLFFGIGNNTVFDQTKPGGHKFYFARYDLVNISLLARSNINRWSWIKYGPVFQYFKLRDKENENKYISTIYPGEGVSKIHYEGKFFGGGEIAIELNTRNNQLIPTRGVGLNIYGRSMVGLNNTSNHVTQTGGDFSLYTDFISRKHFVIATSFGASHIAGNYEFEQAQYLGYRQNLRGFRIQRFAGRSKAYNNTELRLITNNADLGLFRGSLGLLVFNDVGRVWADNEKSSAWHDGYGWGILVAPLNRFVISAYLMYSKEEKNLLMLNVGFQF